MRQRRAAKKRIKQFLVLLFCTGIILVSCIVLGFSSTGNFDIQPTSSVEVQQICRADKEEVFSCLPVQRCAENNSVNSAKVCVKRLSEMTGAFLCSVRWRFEPDSYDIVNEDLLTIR